MPVTIRCVCGKDIQFSGDAQRQDATCPYCGAAVPPPPNRRSANTHILSAGTPSGKHNPFSFSEPATGTQVLKKPPVTAAPPPIRSPRPPSSTQTQKSPVLLPPSPAPARPTQIIIAKPAQKDDGTYELRYMLLGLALIPLIVSLFQDDDDIRDRVRKTIEHLPKKTLRAKVAPVKDTRGNDGNDDESTDSSEGGGDIFTALPDHRIEGALLAHDSWMHWGFALASATFFLGLIRALFPPGNSQPKELLYAGLFTGTLGIVFLLLVQVVAISLTGIRVSGFGKLGLILFLIQIIGYSYQAALNPHNGFIASFLGFTFGVGLCEEICKALPIISHFRGSRARLDWRGACVWGLASGVGFGVSEGINYSSSFYNGVFGLDLYLIRFISCVALHAIWSAAVGIAAFRFRHELKNAQTTAETTVPVLKSIFVPMIMHGLYDTLLKRNHEGMAVLCALCGFVWLAYQIEMANRIDPSAVSAPA